MDEDFDNHEKITFKVKLLDDNVHHEFVFERTGQSRNFDTRKLFEQIGSITGIPAQYINRLSIPPNLLPYHVNSYWRLDNPNALKYFYPPWKRYNNGIFDCDQLIQVMIRIRNQYNSDCFVLAFHMHWEFYSDHFCIYYDLVPEALVSQTECVPRHFMCRNFTKGLLDKIRSIVNDDELNCRIADLMLDEYGRKLIGIRYQNRKDEIARQLNIFQYYEMYCPRGTNSFRHPYLRNRG